MLNIDVVGAGACEHFTEMKREKRVVVAITKQFVPSFDNASWLERLEVGECRHERRKMRHAQTRVCIGISFTGCSVKLYVELFFLLDLLVKEKTWPGQKKKK